MEIKTDWTEKEREAWRPKDKKLTIAQASHRLNCHASTTRRYILTGKLKALQYAKYGKIRIAESEIQRFLAESGYTEPTE